MLAVSMPNFATSGPFVETATKCFATAASSWSAPSSQARAAFAVVIVSRVVDVKTPGSHEDKRNRIENFSLLSHRDQLKFVICSREDYDWSKAFMREHALPEHCQVLFSPSYNEVSPTALAEWILADRLPVRFQLQLHKVLWGDTPGK